MPGHGATILLQSADRGTAAGVLLPAHWIRSRAPDATVAVFPSDHLVLEEERFMDRSPRRPPSWTRTRGASSFWGSPPRSRRRSTGGSSRGRCSAAPAETPVRAVRRFVEKPSPETARACLAAGASWNTFVFVAKASTLVEAGRRCVPRIHSGLERMVHAVRRGARSEAIRRASAAMPVGNFSRDVLQNLTPMLAVTTLTGVTWCDWGSPRRVVESLERLGIRPPWLDRLTEPAGAGSEK